MESHIFNEAKKTLEPTSTICACCQVGTATLETNYYKDIFKENDRTNLVIYRSVSYGKISIGIPRCESCMSIHNDADLIGTIGGILLGIVFFIICLSIFDHAWLLSLGFFGAIAIFVYLGDYGKNWYSNSKGIRSKEEIIDGDSLIAGFLANGWSKHTPSA
jgi:hypothetical protein